MSASFRPIAKSLNDNVSNDIYSYFLHNNPKRTKYQEYQFVPTIHVFHENPLPLLFHSIWKGDLDMVHEFYRNVTSEKFYISYDIFEANSPSRVDVDIAPVNEAALDLAIRFNQTHIADFLMRKNNQISHHFFELKAFDHKKQGLYKRKIFKFNQNEFFQEIMLELYHNSDIKIKVFYRSQVQYYHIIRAVRETRTPGLLKNKYNYYDHNFVCFENNYLKKLNKIGPSFRGLLTALSTLSNENLFDIHLTLDSFYQDIENNFPAFEEPLPQSIHSYRLTTYIDFLMYEAIINNDYIKMRDLLRRGANPNSLFFNRSILYSVLDRTGSLESRKDLANLKELAGVLLEYEADPSIEDLVHLDSKVIEEHKDHLEFLNNCGLDSGSFLHAAHINKTKKFPLIHGFYQDVVRLFPVSEKSWKCMRNHPRLAQPLLAEAILRVNQQMQNVIERKRYIKELEKRESNVIAFNLERGSISIETRKATDLGKDEEILAKFFEQQTNISTKGMSKVAYFLNELKAKSGVVYVDIIKKDNMLVGVYLYEYIKTNINNIPTFIHYSKLITSSLKDCPDLIKLIILIRGFACKLPGYTSITYADVVSHHGFTLADIMKRYPTHYIPGINIDDILEVVRGMPVKPDKVINDCYYFKDDMSVDTASTTKVVRFNKQSESEKLITLGDLSRASFFSYYHQPKYSLSVAIPNNDENLQRLKQTMLPVIGDQNFLKLFSYYTKSVYEFVASNTPSATIRSKL